jgi:hypothetical protein
MNVEQLSLQLFPYRSFPELIDDHHLSNLNVIINKRLHRGWQVRIKKQSHTRELVVPVYLENAPEIIKMALIEWSLLPMAQRRDVKWKRIHDRRKELESLIWEHIESAGITTHRQNRIDPSKLHYETRGVKYDLKEVFNSINTVYFSGNIESLVRWGSVGTTTSYQSTRTAQDGRSYHLITIAGVYNHPDVPQYAIEAVMYHEMLHIAIPPCKCSDRSIIHGAAFKKKERSFPFFEQWRIWEKTHLHILVRKLKKTINHRAR